MEKYYMATKKTIFVAFAIEDERQRDFLKGQYSGRKIQTILSKS